MESGTPNKLPRARKEKREKSSPKSLDSISTLTGVAIATLIFCFFLAGVFIGSRAARRAAPDNPAIARGGIGLPGTNNLLTASYLRTKPPHDSSSGNEKASEQTLASESEPFKEGPIDQEEYSKCSLMADQSSYMVGPNNLDNTGIVLSAWIRLDSSFPNENMRTIFSNKESGCDASPGRSGISLYVNAWSTGDQRLYVEYGGRGSGCNKIGASVQTLDFDKWYHTAVAFYGKKVSLFLDGIIVATSDVPELHRVQRSRPLLLGRYQVSGDTYDFNGNISHFAVVHLTHKDGADSSGSDIGLEESDGSIGLAEKVETVMIGEAEVTEIVAQLKDIDRTSTTLGLKALFPLTDAVDQLPNSVAKNTADASGRSNGRYVFALGKKIGGVPFAMVDGLEGRKVTDEMREEADRLGKERRELIKQGMKHVWTGYKKYAWGRDELKPLSKRGSDNWGGMGVTLVDSLDTLWLLGMKEEFEEAREWVASSLHFDHAGTVSVFETTIRELGGLLAAYEFSKDKVFLDKALELGNHLIHAFDSSSGLPYSQLDMKRNSPSGGWSGNNLILSEIGTLQVEFRYLAHHAKVPRFESVSMKPLQIMHRKKPKNGLYPIKVSLADGSFTESHVTFGALGDSFYEYLLKVWLQGGKQEHWLREMYDRAINGVMDVLLKASSPSGLAFISDWTGSSNQLKMDHLVCFMPGTMALGAYTDPKGINSARAKRDLAVAKALMYTCYQMYHRMNSGISAEYVEFVNGVDFRPGSNVGFYILRPETAESLFYLNQLTGDPIYREWAWEIWENIDRHCRTEVGYGALRSVMNPSQGVDDRMESFFLAETVKYLYLAQDPDKPVDLMEYVFNTEAHPLKIFDDTHKPVLSSNV